jgi:aspartyl-tRNA(Asn)/glutamyl-tRNA(Gln) amidotransferase subunit A
MCGITGLKPTYGRVSRLGMVAYASSLDQGGPMARSAEDCALLLEIMAGHDPRDSTSPGPRCPLPRGPAAGSERPAYRRAAEYFGSGLDDGVEAVVRQALADYEALGATLVDISLPRTELAIPAYYVIAPAEASTNLSRYDGVRYGHRCDATRDLDDLYTRSREEGFGAEVQRRILVGTYACPRATTTPTTGKPSSCAVSSPRISPPPSQQVDLIAGPTTPGVAFPLGAKTDDPTAMYLEDIYTLAVNLAGLPAMSLPAGFCGDCPWACS